MWISSKCKLNIKPFSVYVIRRRIYIDKIHKNEFIPIIFCVFLGSIVYNQTIVYTRQNFLQEIVHVNIIDQCNQTEVTVIYSRAFLVAVMSQCC